MAEENEELINFNFNGSLANINYEKILDIISEKLKNKKQITKNRNRVINLIKETFPNINCENLEDGFNSLYSNIDIPFKYNTIQDLNESINKYAIFIVNINDQLEDHGYSLLLCCYFWLTKKYLEIHKVK